ncbi:hypothetical protein EG68_04535 [Paragonimus skrjabini miyazakii]|uniref:Nardilysin n=1 Tax=Paragonimus skrjabini miyazakii TaxID=59628 RepID=A0A8S9YU19_9TREM|nr:hypothetical protein EG68_04535 [Paragonimus skrjabini miyazakii]
MIEKGSKEDLSINKGLLDKRSYRFFELENGLRVMVVSTIETDERIANGHQPECNGTQPTREEHGILGDMEEMSAAALCINSGGFSDPEEAPGLSHFLEHMLFMGSEKYPGENDFSSHVSTCGGMMNAWTAQERSMFYFQVKTEHFLGCLDRFAQFFIAPLMRDSSVDRELEAVNSEFALAMTNDNNRLQHFLASISAPGSPYRKFIFGNNKSLRDIPLEKGANVSWLLRQHWKANFSADRMTLAIQSYSSLDELECRVREMFEAIPRRAFPAPDYSHFANCFETQEFNKFYKVCSVKQRDMLSIIWSLPSLLPYYQSNPTNVLADLLGDEGEGSILAALRKMHWATELYADACLTSGMRNTTFCSMFEVHVHLTKLGRENIRQVCGVIFDYIKVVLDSLVNETSEVESGLTKNLSQRFPNTFQSYLEERQELWKSSFLYNDPVEALHNCELIAEMMQIVPYTKVVSARYLIEKIDMELYVRLLKLMTPERACIVHQSSEFGRNLESDPNWQTESWFNIRYKSEELSKSLLETWSSSVPSTTGLHLPFKNIFISTNFGLLPKEADMQEPRDLNLDRDAEDRRRYGHLWFQRSAKFEAPRGSLKSIMHIHLWSPEMSGTKERFILQRLFLYAVEQSLSLVAYEGSVASMWYSVDFRLNGLLIHVSGFNEKLFLFYSTILKQILNELPIRSDDQFQAYKGAVRKKIVNWLLDPHSLNSFTYSYLLEKDSYMVDDMLETLDKQSAADLMSFAQRIFQHVRLTVFVYGNITEQEATSIYDYTIYRLRAVPLSERKFGDTAVYDPGTYHIRLLNTNPSDVNMCVTHFHMLGRTDLKTSVFCNLVAYVLNEPAFDYLRTKEMLSYYVALQPWVYRDGGSAHQAILLVCRSQATKFSVDHVSGRMNAFWYRIAPRIIAAMTKQSFRTCINALISEEQLKDTNMWCEYWRGYAEIFSRETIMFKRREKTVEILNTITQDDLLNFFLNEFLDPTRRRTLVVEVAAQTDSVKKLENSLQPVHVTHVEQVMVDREELERQAKSCAEVDVSAVMLTAGYDNQTAVTNLARTTTSFWEDDRHPWPNFDSTELITNVCSFRQRLKFDSGRYV